jgi:outer membrane protein with beta-barrel domain
MDIALRSTQGGARRRRCSIRLLTGGFVAALFVLSLLTPSSALAGKWPHERNGFMLGLNAGGGTAGLSVGNFDSDREGGTAGNFRAGYAVDPQFVLGLEGNVWTKKVDNETWTFSVGGAALTYYPGAGGFFVRGGVGVGNTEYSVENGNVTVTASDDGLGLLGAMGYEWRLTRRFALGPQVDFGWMDVGNDVKANYFNFTVGANWYFK